MKIVIIDSRTRRYLRSELIEYTRAFNEAMDFHDIREAKEFCKVRSLQSHTILAKCDRLGIESSLAEV